MKKYRLKDLEDIKEGHFLQSLTGGRYMYRGAMDFAPPGKRYHTGDGPDGRDYHVHDDNEIFIILQGRAEMEINGEKHPMRTGDIFIIEPGEDHHLIIDDKSPCVYIWFHTGEMSHLEYKEQKG